MPGDRRAVPERGAIVPFVAAFMFGAVSWWVVSALTGKREAWDATAYWAVVYPGAIVVAALLGHFHPERPWRWPVVLFEAQAIAMGIRNGEWGNLVPLGVIVFAVLALPGVAAATLAARRRRGPPMSSDR